jgi:hypothetical protein
MGYLAIIRSAGACPLCLERSGLRLPTISVTNSTLAAGHQLQLIRDEHRHRLVGASLYGRPSDIHDPDWCHGFRWAPIKDRPYDGFSPWSWLKANGPRQLIVIPDTGDALASPRSGRHFVEC